MKITLFDGKTIDYPSWVCLDCGNKYGRRKCGVATFHYDACGICGELKETTEPRDFGHIPEASLDAQIFHLVRPFNEHTLSESDMKRASKNALKKSLRQQKRLTNRLSRIALGFYIHIAHNYGLPIEQVISSVRNNADAFDK